MPMRAGIVSLPFSLNSLSAIFWVGVLVLGDFVWNEDAVAFEGVGDEGTAKATARS